MIPFPGSLWNFQVFKNSVFDDPSVFLFYHEHKVPRHGRAILRNMEQSGVLLFVKSDPGEKDLIGKNPEGLLGTTYPLAEGFGGLHNLQPSHHHSVPEYTDPLVLFTVILHHGCIQCAETLHEIFQNFPVKILPG